MRRTFLLWLLAVICTTFIATGALVYTQFAQHARDRAEQMMAARLSDMLELFKHAERGTTYLSRVNDVSTLDRTRALADIINLRPEILNDQEELQGICNRLGAEKISISDENGDIVAAVPAAEVGYNLAQSEDTMPFLDCVAAPGYELCLRALSGDAEQVPLQHAAVHRLDSPGVVILTFRMRVEHEAREAESLSQLTNSLKLGPNGLLFVFRRGALVSGELFNVSPAELLAMDGRRVVRLSIDRKDYYAYAVDGDGFRLVGAVPVERVYMASVKSVQFLLLSNLILFGVMFAVVSYLLQRFVVRSISRVNEALHEITEGNLEKRVDVENSPEFARLSNGINFMVESIKALGEEKNQSINRDLELARTIQGSLLPNRFPAFPHITEFDLHATCLPSQIVGGDFYDFFMSEDGRRLSFLVADLDASGVPAAMLMMRAMSIIRTRAKAGETPVELVTHLNNDLCGGNEAGICMALFYGTLEIESGKLDYVNAGGMHALLRRVGGDYEMIPCYTGCMLGERKDTEFYTATLELAPEDRIFLYTEGVVLAANPAHTPFGEARLQECLREPAPTVADVLAQVRAALRQHCCSSELQQDVTMLSLEYRGALGNVVSLELKAGETAAALGLLTEKLESLLVAPIEIHDMQYGLRTLLHALPPQQVIGLHVDCKEELGRVMITWPGAMYNPLLKVGELPVDAAYHEYTEADGNMLTIEKSFG